MKPPLPSLKATFIIAGILLSTSLQGQSLIAIHPEAAAGFNIPVGSEFSHVHAPGLSFGGSLFFTVKEKFSIGPSVMVKYHRKNINEGAKDELTGLATGLLADYSIPLFKKQLIFYPQSGIFFQGFNDRIGARNGYRGDNVDVVKANGVGFLFGGALEVQRFRLSIQYNLFTSSPVEFGEDIFDELAKHNQYYTIFTREENTTMDFSSLSIQLGYRFDFF